MNRCVVVVNCIDRSGVAGGGAVTVAAVSYPTLTFTFAELRVAGATVSRSVTANPVDVLEADGAGLLVWSLRETNAGRSAGTLDSAPAGVTLDTVSGVLNVARDTMAGGAFAIDVVDHSGVADRAAVTIDAVAYATPTFAVADVRVAGSTVGRSVTTDLAAVLDAAGAGTLVWLLQNAPPDVSIDAANGVLTVPEGVAARTADDAPAQVTVVGGSGVPTSLPLALDFTSYDAPDLTAVGPIVANTSVVDAAFDLAAAVTGQTLALPMTWSLSSAPAGATVDPVTGVLTVARGLPHPTFAADAQRVEGSTIGWSVSARLADVADRHPRVVAAERTARHIDRRGHRRAHRSRWRRCADGRQTCSHSHSVSNGHSSSQWRSNRDWSKPVKWPKQNWQS